MKITNNNIMNRKKLKKQIKIDTTSAQIIYTADDRSIKWTEKILLNSLKELKAFYQINIPTIELELIYSRKEFNDKIGRMTPDWMVGVAWQNTIYLFSPSVIEKESSHNKASLNKILMHELCHIFNNKINKKILTWVDEGTTIFLARQKKSKDFKKSEWDCFIDNFLTKNVDLTTFAEHNGYKMSYWLIKMLARKLGKERLLDLIKIAGGGKRCEQKIERITGFNKGEVKSLV